MRVGVIQSSYIPWRGYFDIIDCVDEFVFHDDLQYTKGDWRNRNYVKGPDGLQLLSVPVHYRPHTRLIQDTEIDYSSPWMRKHANVLKNAYARAPYYEDMISIWNRGVASRPCTISALNISLINEICEYLSIDTPRRCSREFTLVGAKTRRLVDLMRKIGGTVYVSGPSASSYLELDLFAKAGIRLEYKRYDYPEYDQQFGTFRGDVSILDLIANCGPSSRKYLTKRTDPVRRLDVPSGPRASRATSA